MRSVKLFELQLASWKKSDSHGRAPSVEFFLQSDEDVEYFQRFTSAKGRGKTHIAGQIFNIAIEISEQDDQSKQAIKPMSEQERIVNRHYSYTLVSDDLTTPRSLSQMDDYDDDDDDTGLPGRRIEAEKPLPDKLVAYIAMRCADPHFQEWVSHQFGHPTGEIGSAEYVREVCDVKSRAEIRTGTKAADLFHSEIRRPYAKWYEENIGQPESARRGV